MKERFFIRKDNGNLRELKYEEEIKKNPKGGNYLVKKKLYIGEINAALSRCTDIKMQQMISSLNLTKKDILKVINKYYDCTNEKFYKLYNEKKTKRKIDIEFLGGINFLKAEDSYIIGSNYGIRGIFYVPRTHGRYSISLGYIQFNIKEKDEENISFRSIPIVLNRYTQVTRNYKMYARLGIDRILGRNFKSIGIIAGVGHEYKIPKSRFKISNTIDYRLITLKNIIFNLGLKYELMR